MGDLSDWYPPRSDDLRWLPDGRRVRVTTLSSSDGENGLELDSSRREEEGVP